MRVRLPQMIALAFPPRLMAGLAVGLLALSATALGAQESGFDPDDIAAHVARTLARDRVPGAAVAIVRSDGILFLQGFGNDARGGPVDENTGFVIGSMSKAFTALAAMRLIEAGRLTLDTGVGPEVPELGGSDRDAWDDVTLGHLLTHTSGVPTRTPEVPPDAPLARHVAALAGVKPAHRPGERHVYSSANYVLAARMLETIIGEAFDDLLAAQVLGPLGFVSGESSRSGGHRYWFIWPRPVDLPVEPGRLATASVTASAREMARFLQFQLGDGTWQGATLLSAAGLAAMHEGRAQGDGFTYGLGWRTAAIAGVRTVQHGGVLPDYRGKMILLPDQDMAVVVLTNVSSVLPLPVTPTSHRLANDIALHIAGGPLGLPHLGYRNWLIVFWGGLGLILLHQVATVARILFNRDPARSPLLSAAADVAMVLAIVFVLPWAIGLSLRSILVQTPDLALWLAVMVALAMCAVILRIRTVVRRGRRSV